MKMENGRYVQVGIVSIGDTINCITLPKGFTRVDVLMPWIQEQIKSIPLYAELSPDDPVIDPVSMISPYSLWSDDVLYAPEYA